MTTASEYFPEPGDAVPGAPPALEGSTIPGLIPDRTVPATAADAAPVMASATGQGIDRPAGRRSRWVIIGIGVVLALVWIQRWRRANSVGDWR